MPNSYGHAKDFFNKIVKDGQLNKGRNLVQFTNPSSSKPQESDLIIFSGSKLNSFGHVAIISKVTESQIEIIQQNPGPFGSSRAKFKLSRLTNGKWFIHAKRNLGWLRKK